MIEAIAAANSVKTSGDHLAVAIVAADPKGACMYHWIVDGEVKATEGGSITEGIGQGRVTGNIDGAPVDDAFQIPDAEALPRILARVEEAALEDAGAGPSAIRIDFSGPTPARI